MAFDKRDYMFICNDVENELIYNSIEQQKQEKLSEQNGKQNKSISIRASDMLTDMNSYIKDQSISLLDKCDVHILSKYLSRGSDKNS
jgi:hypothetical protein